MIYPFAEIDNKLLCACVYKVTKTMGSITHTHTCSPVHTHTHTHPCVRPSVSLCEVRHKQHSLWDEQTHLAEGERKSRAR
mmetsp:Transcript_43908/g.124336  ORF Transcript_43908/g.124336 Transcript_43908/m.124336 type:complete len:80 (+) Transcript_43908:162-401(+)